MAVLITAILVAIALAVIALIVAGLAIAAAHNAAVQATGVEHRLDNLAQVNHDLHMANTHTDLPPRRQA